MKTFIVHIYCCEKNNPRSFVGVSEEVGSEGKRAFTTIDDFWKILSFEDVWEGAEDDSPP
jgi:hypothetical protein